MPRSFPAWPLVLLLLYGCGSDEPTPQQWNPNAGAPPRDENFHGGPNAMLLKYDANKDGTLTRAELTAGLKAEFALADVHHNGCLDDDQVAAINQGRIDADRSTATPLMDWNHDGCVDFTEFSAVAYSLFDQLDKNGDGKIEPKEFNPHAAAQKPGAKPDGGHRRGRRGGQGQDPSGQGAPPPDQPPPQ